MRYGLVARGWASIAAIVIGASLLVLAGTAGAATYNASTTAQFEEAVSKANANAGANTIVLKGGVAYLPAITETFTNTSGPLTIEGPSGSPAQKLETAKIDGGAVLPFPSELFIINSGVSVTFKDVEIAHGGGSGVATIEDFGSVGVESSLVSGNTGTAVVVQPGATATVRNSTFSDGADFGVVNDGTASFFNSTVAFNKNGGIENKGTLNLTNTIVAENTGSGDCEGKATTSDHSLDSNGSCGVGALSKTNPLLQAGSPANDGGSTRIHSLKPGSPAIGAGDPATCTSIDQRGAPRANPCSIGADEYSAAAPTIKVPQEITTEATGPEGAVITYTAEATGANDVIRTFGCTPASGATFAIGTTTVTCTAVDGHENTATATFKVVVFKCSTGAFCVSFGHTETSALTGPSDVAVDPGGNIWVASSGQDQVLEFNSKREFVRQFGSAGTGEGQFNGIGGLASDSSGDIYVTDSGNNRVEEFSPTGTFVRQFGSQGTGAGQFSTPTGIALDSSGNVWVLNTRGVLAQEFSATGTYISGFGSAGYFSGGGSGVAFSGGNLYLTEQLAARVREYSTAGTLLATFDEKGSGTGKSSLPSGIATDPTTGNLYVSDSGKDNVQEFSAAGAFIATFGSQGSGAGQFSGPEAVAVGPFANVYVADTGNNRVQEWAAPKTAGEAPTYATSFTQNESAVLGAPSAVAVDPTGNIWVAGGHDQVLEFNSKREYVRQLGSEGSGEGQFKAIGGIASDSSGDVYVTDSGNNRVEEFSPTGTFVRQFGSAGTGAGQFSTPTGIALDSTGNVWVLNSHGGVLAQKFSATGTYISGFGTVGGFSGGGAGLAFSGGNLYVTEQLAGRVQEYSTTGTSLAIFDERGSGTGKSSLPSGIATDPTTGNLYVSDTGKDNVQEFSAAGAFIATFGSQGSGAGQFSGPKGVAVNSSGRFFVADSGNNRVEEW